MSAWRGWRAWRAWRAWRGSAFGGLAFAALMTIGVVRWRDAVPALPVASLNLDVVARPNTDSLEAHLAESEALIVSNDPFRIANEPAGVRFDATVETSAGANPIVAPPPLRPVMTLKAVIGGPPWQAVIDGIPGQAQGTLVRTGSAFDKLVMRTVTRDSVVVQGPDTTWILSFRRRQ